MADAGPADGVVGTGPAPVERKSRQALRGVLLGGDRRRWDLDVHHGGDDGLVNGHEIAAQ
jgi:hypothetical protein